MSLKFNTLYRSEVITVIDARCRPGDSCRSREEVGSSNNIVFPRRGCFVRHLGRTEAVADANTVHFFRTNEPYRVSHPVSGGDDCTSLCYAPAILADAFAAFDPAAADRPDDPFRPTRTLATPEAIVALHRFRRSLCTPTPDVSTTPSLAKDEAAMRLLEVVARSTALFTSRKPGNQRPGTVCAHRDLAEHARIVLSAHLAEPVSLPEIARRVHSSPFHLARVFRNVTGLSLHQYLTRLRLNAALEQLAAGADDLTSLALSLGFASHSHFSDAFRRAFRVTPSNFRHRN